LAKIEFFKIKIIDDKNQDIKMINVAQLLKTELKTLSSRDKYCKHHKCDASMLNYIHNIEPFESTTFDFIKFTPEVITSTIISAPKEGIDTFKFVNKNLIENSQYSIKDIEKVRKVVNKKDSSFLDIVEDLGKIKLNNFSIYKILIKENLNKKENNISVADMFDKDYLERLKKDETYFNLTYYQNINILMLQKTVNGFNFKKLNDYLNYYILKNTKYKIHIEYIYDNDFMELLANSDLGQFKFSFDLRNKNLLEDNNFTNPFRQILDSVGKSKITISSEANKNEKLDNDTLVNFFISAKESGILDTAKLRKKGGNKVVDSLSKGDYLVYSSRDKIESLDGANQVFLKAFEDREEIIQDKNKEKS